MIRKMAKWKWTWDSNNTIAIYEPTDGLNARIVASIWEEEYDGDDCKTQMEATATLICESVNNVARDSTQEGHRLSGDRTKPARRFSARTRPGRKPWRSSVRSRPASTQRAGNDEWTADPT